MNKKPIITNKQGSESKYQKQVDKSHYDFDKYLHTERWISYYYAVREVLSVAKALKRESIKVLEIGVGDKTVSSVLKAQGMDVVTMDIDPELKPDYVSALPQIHLPKKYKFDCILCCEVLEHLRYKDSEKALSEFAKRAKYSVISVPQKSIFLTLSVKPWFFKTRKMFFSVKNFRRFRFNGEHYWEIGANGVTKKKFKKSLTNAGLRILKDFRLPEMPYQHFFITKSLIQ